MRGHGSKRISSGLRGLAALALAGGAAWAMPGTAAAQPPAASERTIGHATTTGGTLDFGDRAPAPPQRRVARATPPAPKSTPDWWQQTWLHAFVTGAFVTGDNATPSPQRRGHRAVKPRTVASLVTPPTAGPPVVSPPTEPAAQAPATITTGALQQAVPAPITPDASAALIVAAERTQARLDLVKLELAARAYNERRLSGQSAFDLRRDWHVLERARDALTSAELSAAEAAGFEANAYINETDKVIVVAIAGTQDLRRDFLEADIWKALIQAQAPQQFFLAKSYVRSVMQRYQMRGFATECVGHSLGGGACAYAAGELAIRGLVVNPISAGRLADAARSHVTNYVVDGDIAQLVYEARGNPIEGDLHIVADGRNAARARVVEKYGLLAGPILVVRDLRDAVKVHQIDRALDLIAAHAGMERQR